MGFVSVFKEKSGAEKKYLGNRKLIVGKIKFKAFASVFQKVLQVDRLDGLSDDEETYSMQFTRAFSISARIHDVTL